MGQKPEWHGGGFRFQCGGVLASLPVGVTRGQKAAGSLCGAISSYIHTICESQRLRQMKSCFHQSCSGRGAWGGAVGTAALAFAATHGSSPATVFWVFVEVYETHLCPVSTGTNFRCTTPPRNRRVVKR